MRDITLSATTVEILIDAARLGVQFLQDQMMATTEDRYERSNIRSQIRRTEHVIDSIDRLTFGVEIQQVAAAQKMSERAETRREYEDMSDMSDSKMNWIEGKR
jgi:hypothetical protein|tara:strand:+ start:35711 stop:36019 length:309 start_codon:yes stop_codon:yes gene_type:complete